MQLHTLNAAGKPLAPPQPIDRRRRRLTQVLGRHVDHRRPFMVAVQRASDPLQPIDEGWVSRGWKVPPVKDAQGRTIKPGKVKPWPRMYLPADAIVVIVYLPRGGVGGASGSRSKSPLSIAMGIAGLALVAFAGPIAGLAFASGTFGAAALTAGIVLGGTAVGGLAIRKSLRSIHPHGIDHDSHERVSEPGSGSPRDGRFGVFARWAYRRLNAKGGDSGAPAVRDRLPWKRGSAELHP